jgi:hypothetical protein
VRLQLVEQVRGEVDGPATGVGLAVLDPQNASGKIDGVPAQLAELADAKPAGQHRREKGSMLTGRIQIARTSSSSSHVRRGFAAFSRRFLPRAGFELR